MPKRTDIKSILIIGAGPIVIGQACEFDYSGTQACKALKEEGYRIVLVNSNPATIMTDPDLADATYIEPITPEIVAKIIEKERPDALLPTMGGQTALNTALSLRRMGVLDKFGVKMIGADADAIDKAEDRELFREAMTKIGLETPKSALADASDLKQQDRAQYAAEIERIKAQRLAADAERDALDQFEAQWEAREPDRKKRYIEKGLIEALQALHEIGLPAIIRPSFTLAGTGGGIAYTREEFLDIVERGLDASPTTEVLIEESVLGWKEFEMEVVRDRNDNCIIICSIENLDPMGVHTGEFDHDRAGADAHRQGIPDHARRLDRGAARDRGRDRRIERAVRGQSGGRTPGHHRDEPARVALLGAGVEGNRLPDRQGRRQARGRLHARRDRQRHHRRARRRPRSSRPSTTSSPRFRASRSRSFPAPSQTLTTSMKSVGEAMAIGRTFQESIQKALRSLETGLTGFDEITIEGIGKDEGEDRSAIRAALGTPTPDRLLKVAQAMRHGLPDEQIFAACKIDPWFLAQIRGIIDKEAEIKAKGLPKTAPAMRRLKAMGFSDARLGKLTGIDGRRR